MEPAALDLSLYKAALIVLGAAAVVIPLFHRLRVSSVLGFMLVGVVVGPFGLASLAPGLPWLSAISIGDPESIEPIARLGVVLLLFMIGLELSVERLIVMRRLVFGLGCIQVVLCAGALAGVAMLLGYGWIGAAVVGVALAMSSTAVVIQVLSEEKRLNTTTGRTSFAVLLFQDLAVVPMLFLLGALDPTKSAGGWAGFGVAAAQALIAVAAIIALGRLALRPLFRGVARTRSPELFVAACLLVVIAAGLATAAAGLSMALGALIGGLLLAGTEYRRQVEVTIDPFKGLFVGVFLVSVGMSLDIRTLIAHPLLVLSSSAGVVVLKSLVVTPLARVFGASWATALRTALLLGPGGEFAFGHCLGGARRASAGARRRKRGAVRHRPDDGDHSAAVRVGRSACDTPRSPGGGRSQSPGAGEPRCAHAGHHRGIRPGGTDGGRDARYTLGASTSRSTGIPIVWLASVLRASRFISVTSPRSNCCGACT
jgi:monovalent cation:H+ antiporter-2, CPA2 family